MTELRHLLRSNLKFKHLQMLVAISDRLHIGRVAEHMHLSQPAISKSLAELESIVGAQLFERTSSGLVETSQGAVFAQYARMALAQVARLGDDLQAAQLGKAGTIHIGTVSAASRLVFVAIELFKRQSPSTTVRLEEGLMESLVERLRLGELDLVIVRVDTVADRSGLILEPIYDDAVVAVAAPDSPLASQPDLRWADLANHPWVLPPPDTFSRRRYEDALRQHGVGLPKDLVETASFLAMIMLTRERHGVCAMSEGLARYFERIGVFAILPLAAVSMRSAVGMVRLEERQHRPATELFAKCFTQAVRLELPERSLIP